MNSHTASSHTVSSHLTSYNNINQLILNVQNNQLRKIEENSIKTENLDSCIYYENIKNTGKNILLIGESHINNVDVSEITGFFASLINNRGNKCLDIFIEDARSDIPLKIIKRGQNLTYKGDSSLSTDKIRKFLYEDKNDTVRKHYIDYRLTFGYGFLNCVFYILANGYIRFHPEQNFIVLLFLLNLKDEDGYMEGQDLIFTLLKNYDGNIVPIVVISTFIKDKKIDTLDSFYDEIRQLNSEGITSGTKTQPQTSTINQVQLQPWSMSETLEKIYNHRGYDNKINKQINNIDTEYFTREDFLQYYKNSIVEIRTFLLDIIAITRMFRKFNYAKNRVPECNNEETSLKNIILYSGHLHTMEIQKFIDTVIFNNNDHEIKNSKRINTYFIPIPKYFNYFNFFYFNFFPDKNRNFALIDKYKEFCNALNTNNINKVKDLLKNIDINKKYLNGETFLITACSFGKLDIVELLLTINDININEKDDNGKTALMIACSLGHVNIANLLLNRNDINVKEKDNDGRTAAELLKEYKITNLIK